MVHRSDPSVAEDRRQIADVAVNDLKIRQRSEPLAAACEIRVALDHTTRQSGRARSAITRVIGPVPAPSSTTVRRVSSQYFARSAKATGCSGQRWRSPYHA